MRKMSGLEGGKISQSTRGMETFIICTILLQKRDFEKSVWVSVIPNIFFLVWGRYNSFYRGPTMMGNTFVLFF